MGEKKVLIVTNWDWTIYNFRLPIARYLRDRGHEVVFVCPFGKYISRIKSEGFRCRDWTLSRHGKEPLSELFSVYSLMSIYLDEDPDLVANFTIKPNIYGGIVTSLPGMRSIPVVNTFEGLGELFGENFRSKALRLVIAPLLKFVSQRRNILTIFLNKSDQKKFTNLGLANPVETKFIPGIGVDTTRFSPGDCAFLDLGQQPVVVMACRLLREKGVEEFAKAAQILESRDVDVEMVLAGEPDKENPDSVPEEVVQQWNDSGILRWLGHIDNISELLRCSDIAVLPTSYNEGVPRFLMEAASTGLPLIASDIPGCRLLVDDEKNGKLIPPRDAAKLADQIETLVEKSDKRKKLGNESRKKIKNNFDISTINKIWHEVIKNHSKKLENE